MHNNFLSRDDRYLLGDDIFRFWEQSHRSKPRYKNSNMDKKMMKKTHNFNNFQNFSKIFLPYAAAIERENFHFWSIPCHLNYMIKMIFFSKFALFWECNFWTIISSTFFIIAQNFFQIWKGNGVSLKIHPSRPISNFGCLQNVGLIVGPTVNCLVVTLSWELVMRRKENVVKQEI